MNLPFSDHLSTNKLASSFANTSATYKFYWLIAIIELVEERNQVIKKRKIFSRMISNSWYTVNYFHLSFGKQDLIQKAVKEIIVFEKLAIDEKKDKIISILENTNNIFTQRSLDHFNINVPHWFLSPWFPKIKGENDASHKNRIYFLSQSFQNDCLYGLYDDEIIINPKWISYLKLNSKILKDFCYWNLALFLQSRNPNVPDIPNKLIKPAIRNGLIKQRNNYWNIVFRELGSVNCIFTDKKLFIDNFAIDHFIPHAFVSHNLIWNLIPIDKNFNSSKSDKLPSIDKYFNKFFELQKTAFEIVSNQNPKNKLLEEYFTIFPVLNSSNDFEYLRYKESMQPLISIAHNNGFLFLEEN